MAEAKVALQNRIKTGGDDIDWTVMPPGQYPMALVDIRNVDIDGRHFPGGTIQPGYRFVFQGKDDPNFMVTLDCTAIIGGNRAKLPKLVRNMSGNTLTDEMQENADHFFDFMTRLVNRWYIVPVKVNKWVDKQGIDQERNKVSDVSVIPHPEGSKWGKAEKQPFRKAEKKVGAGGGGDVSTGFESYKDGGLSGDWTKTPYMYEIKFADSEEKKNQQKAFIKSKHGLFNPGNGMYHFAEKIPQLEGFYAGEFKPEEVDAVDPFKGDDEEVTFDNDTIPF